MTKAKGSTKKRKDPMDGAYFAAGLAKDNTPADFISVNGLRPGEKDPPRGDILLDLTWTTIGKTIPPRSVWSKGHWQSADKNNKGWDVWVVSGEGTPGNYKERHYKLPEERTYEVTPDHPADWPKKEWKSDGWKGGSSSSSASSSSSLPFGLRIRCPGCGHFYRMNDLSDHSKNACPATQAQPAMWVIECACHEGDLQTAATVLPGFPVKPPDTPSGDGKKEEGGENETGGSAKSESKTGAAA